MPIKRPLGVIGLGNIGLPLALTLSAADHEVIVWDKNQNTRNMIEGEVSPIDEPFVQGMLEQMHELIFVRPDQMSIQASMIFIAVPAPPYDDGSINPGNILNVIKTLGQNGGRRALPIVVCSTVSPGTCRNILMPAVSRYGMRLAYFPITGSPGSLVRDLSYPEIQIIGHCNDGAGHIAMSALRTIAPNAPQHFMSFESAELSVLSADVYRAFKLCFANMIGRLCEQYEANVDSVLDALALHHEIGGVGLRAGSGYGGPSLPDDLRAFAAAGGALGTIVEKMNNDHLKWIVSKVRSTKVKSFAIVGRSFKEGSNCRTNSFGDRLSEELSNRILLTSVDQADIVIVTQPLKTLNLCELIKPGCTVIDLWRTHPYLSVCDVTYLPFGG